jgi:hypothetical protein
LDVNFALIMGSITQLKKCLAAAPEFAITHTVTVQINDYKKQKKDL